ncbi:MAG: hypothetical protein LBB11_02050 [Puniceicoccales bacterium]|jgi:hypothetical protein|nr:hypothetical protein [Puniceicoccales bacterium]
MEIDYKLSSSVLLLTIVINGEIFGNENKPEIQPKSWWVKTEAVEAKAYLEANELKKVVPVKKSSLEILKKDPWINESIRQIKESNEIDDEGLDQFVQVIRAKIAYPDCSFNDKENKITRTVDGKECVLSINDIDREFDKKVKDEAIWETTVAPLLAKLYEGKSGGNRSEEACKMCQKIMKLKTDTEASTVDARIQAYLEKNKLKKVVSIRKPSLELLKKDPWINKTINRIREGNEMSDEERSRFAQFVRAKIAYPDCNINEKGDKITRTVGGKERVLSINDIDLRFNEENKDESTIWKTVISPLLTTLYKQEFKDDKNQIKKAVEKAWIMYGAIMKQTPDLMKKRSIQTLIQYS